MKNSAVRLGIAVATCGVIASTFICSAADAAPPFYPDLVGEALTFSAVPDVSGTVPSGVCSGRFIVRGGAGAGASLAAQSYPGQVAGYVDLQAGQTILLKTGTSANVSTGGVGGNGNGGNGYTIQYSGTTYIGYGGGAGSSFWINGTGIAIAGGGGGAGSSWQGNQPGGGGGAGVNGAGGDGTSAGGNQALGGTATMTGLASGQNGQANLYGGAGGGGGYSGGQGSTAGLSAGGGSNYANTNWVGMNLTMNGNYGSVASGYAGISYVACANPSAVTSISVTPNGTSALLAFPPAVDNGTPVTGYQYSVDNGTTWNALATSGTSNLTATISALATSTSYTIRVRPVFVTAAIVANSGGGQAAYAASVSQSFTTLAQDPAPSPSSSPSSSASTLSSTGAGGHGGMGELATVLLLAGATIVMFARRTLGKR